MSACWRCRTPAPDGANYCAECGAELRRPATPTIDPYADSAGGDFVTAAGTGPRRWPLAAGAALIIVLVGVFAFLGDSEGPIDEPTPDDGLALEPDPFADATSSARTPTTTTSPVAEGEIVGDLEIGDVLEVSGFPVGIGDVGDSVFVFTTATPVGYGLTPGNGLHAWEHRPDGTWIEHSDVIPSVNSIADVTVGGGGLIAVGLGQDGAPRAWRSSDGTDWTSEPLPTPITDAGPRMVAAVDGLTVIAGQEFDPWMRLNTALQEHLGPVAELGNADLSSDTARVRGPFGLVLAEAALSDLGLTAGDLFSPIDAPESVIWTDTGDGWRVDSLTGQVFDIDPGGNGEVLANRAGPNGLIGHRFDGSTWTETAVRDIWGLTAWRDGYVGHQPNGDIGFFDAEFEPISTFTVPNARGADIGGIGAGADGLALVLAVWSGTPDRSTQRVVVLRDDLSIGALSSGALVFEEEGDTVLRVSAWDGPADGREYRFDIASETFTFRHPETGEDLTTLTLAELAQLEHAVNSGSNWGPRLSLAFTPDGESWFDRSLATYVAGAYPQLLHVRGEQTYVLAVEWSSATSSRTVIIDAAPAIDQ